MRSILTSLRRFVKLKSKMATITKNSIVSKALNEKGLVVLPLEQYEKLRKKIERLEKAKKIAIEEAEVLRIVAEGEREYREGKLKPIRSLSELR